MMDELKKKNIFVRLYKGDLSLAKTFWLPNILLFLVGTLAVYTASIFIKSPGAWLIYLFFYSIIIWIFHLLIFISILNACKKHKGLLIWRILSRIYSILGLVSFIIIIYCIAFAATVIITDINNNSNLRDKTFLSKLDNYLLNQNLPQKISDVLSLERIMDDQKQQTYIFKNTDPNQELIFDRLDNFFCREMLDFKQNKKVVFQVYDQNNKLKQENELTYGKCLKIINASIK
ncbi:hypothetical protein [Francisella sp. W12-1067]